MLRWILLNLNGTAVVAGRERESRVALPSMQENLSNKCEKNELEWLFFFAMYPQDYDWVVQAMLD